MIFARRCEFNSNPRLTNFRCNIRNCNKNMKTVPSSIVRIVKRVPMILVKKCTKRWFFSPTTKRLLKLFRIEWKEKWKGELCNLISHILKNRNKNHCLNLINQLSPRKMDSLHPLVRVNCPHLLVLVNCPHLLAQTNYHHLLVQTNCHLHLPRPRCQKNKEWNNSKEPNKKQCNKW